jgi:DNA-binding CsgD family transcriptional regulator/tetratricopeptide (TPR) repeat protein
MTTLLIGTGLPIARDVADAIHSRTDGIPLHVEELLAVLAESGFDGVENVRGANVPETVEDAITTRIEACSSPAREVARAGAVIGRAFDLDLLSAVMDVPPEQLSEPLEELASQFLLLPARTPGRYGFRHALICDTIYERIPVPERRRLHRRSADAATGGEMGTDAFLALHYERAGRRQEAFDAALRGARAASAISAHSEARQLYACAVRTASADLPAMERARLFEGLAASAAATDDNEAADAAFSEARAAYLAAGDQLAAAAVVGPLVAVRHLLGDGLEARADALRSALAEIVAPPAVHGVSVDPSSDRVRGELLAGLAAAYMLDRRLDEGIAYATDARALATAANDEAAAQHVAATLGACLVFAGRMDDGWQMLEGSIATSLDLHLEAEASRGYRMLATSASMLVEYPRAERWLREGIDYAERAQLWNHRHYMTAHLGHVLWATGRWDEATELARGALADGRGGITTRITALHVLGFVALSRGEFDGAVDLLEEALVLGQRMNELQRLAPALWGLAETARLRGDAATTVGRSEEALRASERVGDAAYAYPFLVTGCRAFLELGDPLAAERWVARVGGRISERGIPGTLPAIDHGTGLVLLAQGSTGRARQALERAVAGWADRTRTWEGTWASIDLARCLVRANAKVEAARLAAAARDAGARLGSPPLTAAAEVVLATTGRRGQAADPWAPLTAREFQVARLVADGLTNPEIGAELTVAPKTVAAHVEHILAKLGVGRRSEIAAWAASRAVLHSRPHDGDREE